MALTPEPLDALTPTPAAPARVPPWAIAVFIGALVVLTYWPTLTNGYIWDDDHYVTGNRTLLDLHGLWRIWAEPGAVPQYYPLVHTTFWLQYQLTGLAPGPFHLVNLLLQAAVAILVWLTLRRLQVRGAWLAGALFAVHPLNVETVAWVTERKNLLSAVGYFLALLAYLRALDWPTLAWRPGGRAFGWYALASLCFVAALLSKTVTCTLPAVLVVLVWWHTGTWGRREWRAVLPLVPWLVVGVGFGLFTAKLEREHVGAVGPEWAFSLADRVLIAGRALWFYLGQLALPHDLCFIYPRWQLDDHAAWQYLFPLTFVALLLTLWWRRHAWGRGPVTAVALYAGTLFPALGFINVYPMRYSFVADHFAYLATVPLLALLAHGLSRLPALLQQRHTAALAWGAAALSGPPPAPTDEERRLAWEAQLTTWAVPTVLLLTLGLLASFRTAAYRDEESLWRDTLRHNPTAWIAENNLGEVYRQRSDYENAVIHLTNALKLDPKHARAHNNLAMCYDALGQDELALTHFKASLDLVQDPMVIVNLGNFFANRHDLARARRCYGQALALAPSFTLAMLNLAQTYAAEEQWEQALSWYEKIRAADPPGFHLYRELGDALEHLGRYREAAAAFGSAQLATPNDATLIGRHAHAHALAAAAVPASVAPTTAAAPPVPSP